MGKGFGKYFFHENCGNKQIIHALYCYYLLLLGTSRNLIGLLPGTGGGRRAVNFSALGCFLVALPR